MSQTKEEHLSEVLRFYIAAENGYTRYQSDFHELLDIYRGELSQELIEELSKSGKSHLAYRKARAIVDRYVAGVKSTYFTNDQFASIGSYDTTEEAEKLSSTRQKAFDFHWRHTINGYKPFSMAVYDSGIYGTGAVKVYWDGAKDSPRMEHVNIHDIWYDPDAMNIEDCRFIVHNYKKSRSDIKSLKKAGVFNANFRPSELSTMNTDVSSGSVETSHSRINLSDIYYKKDGGWYVTTVHEKSIVLRREIPLADGQPFIVGGILEQIWDDREAPVRIYHNTFLSSIDTMQKELTARVNQQLDAIALNNNPKYFTEASTGLNDSDLKTGAGRQVVLTNIMQKEMIPPPSVGVLATDVDRISRQMEESTGVKSLTGDSQSAMVNRQTAHGMEILSNESNMMPDSYIRSWNETFVEPLVKRMVNLIWKHSSRGWLFRDVSRTQQDDFFVSINAGLGATSKAIQIQGLDKLFQQFMAVGDQENARRIIKDTLPLYGKKNTTAYFPSEEGSKQEREAMQQKQMQMQEQQFQLQLMDLQAKVEENKAQAQRHIATAEEANSKKEITYQKVMTEIEVMKAELELKRIELEHKMDMDIQQFDLQDRDIGIKELALLKENTNDNQG